MQLLKQRHHYDNQLSTAMDKLFNLESMHAAIDAAVTDKEIMAALQVGTGVLKVAVGELQGVDQVMDDLQ